MAEANGVEIWFAAILIFILAVKLSEYIYDYGQIEEIARPQSRRQVPSEEPKDDLPPPYDEIDKYSLVQIDV